MPKLFNTESNIGKVSNLRSFETELSHSGYEFWCNFATFLCKFALFYKILCIYVMSQKQVNYQKPVYQHFPNYRQNYGYRFETF